MILTPTQIDELLTLVDYHVSTFLVQNVGTEILTPDDKTLLRRFGVDIDAYKGINTNIDEAFKFGILSESLGEAQAKAMTYSQLKDYIKSAKFIPLTTYEKDVLNSVKHQSFKDIKGLGNRMKGGLESILIDVDRGKRARTEKIIREEAVRTIENRETLKDFVSRLHEKTGDWTRDFGRIADYIMHQAFDEGRAVSIERREGKDALCYKDVFPGACKICIKLYLTTGIGSRPIIFKLSDLIANGTNIGRKAKDYKPVIGPTHPFCRCTLNDYNPDYEWDPDTGEFDKLKEYKTKRKHKVKVRVGGEKGEWKEV